MKRKTALILLFVFSIILNSFSVITAFAENEVPNGYTPVYTAEDLNNIRNNLSGKYILMNDIDLSSFEKWTPIGTELSPFNGELDGNNMSVKGLKVSDTISSSNRASAGLFAFVSGSTIKDLSIIDANIEIQNETWDFYAVGIISGNSKFSNFSSCSTSGRIYADVNGTCSAGGISGELTKDSSIIGCENTADITVDGKSELYIGGIVGSSYSNVSICHNDGNISVNNAESEDKNADIICIGGICGNMYTGEILNCYNTGNIIIDCVSNNTEVGGIGGNTFSITNCYSSGTITFSNQSAAQTSGGISGKVVFFYDGMGLTENIESYVKNCYCTDTYSKALGNTDSTHITNVKILSDAEMKKRGSFVGFDFSSVWVMGENGYPILRSSSNPEIELVNAEIVHVPLKNRIVFSMGKPADPDGIILKLTYSDGTIKEAAIEKSENGFSIDGIWLNYLCEPALISYGIKTDTIFLNDFKTVVRYKYLVLPPIITIIIGLIHK